MDTFVKNIKDKDQEEPDQGKDISLDKKIEDLLKDYLQQFNKDFKDQ